MNLLCNRVRIIYLLNWEKDYFRKAHSKILAKLSKMCPSAKLSCHVSRFKGAGISVCSNSIKSLKLAGFYSATQSSDGGVDGEDEYCGVRTSAGEGGMFAVADNFKVIPIFYEDAQNELPEILAR